MNDESYAFTTYSIFHKEWDPNILNVVKQIAQYTGFNQEYTTKVEIKDIMQFDHFEIIVKHKIKELGYITQVRSRKEFTGLIQISTNMPANWMKDLIVQGTMKYNIKSIQIYTPECTEMSGDYYTIMDEINAAFIDNEDDD